MKRTALPPSSVAFDWTMGIFSVLIMAGVFQDGWAHNHGLVDQSFLTPWHAILYGTMAVAGVFLLATGVRNMLRGYTFRNGLPFGYWTSAIGVVIFIGGGFFDLYWHTLFGIEVNIQGLISPSHLLLAFGGALVFAGVFRSIAFQYGSGTGGWKRIGPAVCAALATLMLLGFFTQYSQPYGDDTILHVIGPKPPASGGALYSVFADGSRETRIATISGHDIYGATVSPDGKHVAFRVQPVTDNTAPSDIYVADADGTHAVRITHSGRHDTQPAWSPDGSRIAYISMPAQTSGNFKLLTVYPDGSHAQTLVDGVTTIQDPAWSPDSRFIAFSSRNGLTAQIAIVPSTDGPQQWLTATAGGSTPAWSKNGDIAFQTGDGNVAVTRIGSSAAQTIAKNATAPAWSSDGTHLAYLSDENGATQVVTTNARGTGATNVSQLSGLDALHPAWSASNQIFFTATGRPRAAQSGISGAYGIDAAIVSTVILAGVVLLIVRRWRAPIGAVTVLVTCYITALSTQSDLYFLIPGAICAAVLTDVALAFLGDRARTGVPLYAIAFALPCAIFALYLASAYVYLHGLGWPGNMLLGSPLIAGVVGLLVGFCYAPPLRVGQEVEQRQSERAVSPVTASWEKPVTTS